MCFWASSFGDFACKETPKKRTPRMGSVVTLKVWCAADSMWNKAALWPLPWALQPFRGPRGLLTMQMQAPSLPPLWHSSFRQWLPLPWTVGPPGPGQACKGWAVTGWPPRPALLRGAHWDTGLLSELRWCCCLRLGVIPGLLVTSRGWGCHSCRGAWRWTDKGSGASMNSDGLCLSRTRHRASGSPHPIGHPPLNPHHSSKEHAPLVSPVYI